MIDPSRTKLRILLVEDQDEDAELLERMLRRGAGDGAFFVDRAETLHAAFDYLTGAVPDLILLDLGLPDCSDLGGLRRLSLRYHATPIVVLTGSADPSRAIDAIGMGAQDYLQKDSMTPELLRRSIRYARERARILERANDLLEKTLHGSVEAVTAVLAMANPTAFGRAVRLKQHAGEIARLLSVDAIWPIEVAAMVSHVGCINLSDDTCRKLYEGAPLSDDEIRDVDRLPQMAEALLAHIPGLEPVRDILAWQEHLQSHQTPQQRRSGAPQAAWILFIATQFDSLETVHHSAEEAIRLLMADPNRFDATVVRALSEARSGADIAEIVECPASTLLVGMTLATDVTTKDGRLLVSRGLVVTPELALRIRKFAEGIGIEEPIRLIRRTQLTLSA